jgi:hypothetical protein
MRCSSDASNGSIAVTAVTRAGGAGGGVTRAAVAAARGRGQVFNFHFFSTQRRKENNK